jgi:hypothetical protein
MISSLDHFIAQVRAAQIRGLPITADHVLRGLEYALGEKREHSPVPFELGAEQVELLARQQREADRRFGQPHFGHNEPLE